MKRIVALLCLCLVAATATAQGYENPVLPGFYPDPSICRVGEDYYLVNSSFQFFPGVPIHHSKDLIHWTQIGHCLTRKSQLDLTDANFWLGIYAPTIRHHDGRFYMTTTRVPFAGNFYVYATDPAGEWSEPIHVAQDGIDSDLFFDEEKSYFLSAARDAVQLTEIDLATGKLLGETREIWRGTGGRYPEGPHLYKKDGYYYLLIAEGGTEYGHQVVIARSHAITGPYESNPANPILTHFNRLGENNPIQGLGHADLVEAHDGSWWLVCLGFRPQSYNHHLLGRETFLAPVRWDKNAWCVVNGNGTLDLKMEVATLPQAAAQKPVVRTDFDSTKLGFEWIYLCNPTPENYSLTEHKGSLRLKATPIKLDTYGVSPTFVARRQQHIACRTTTAVDARGLKRGAEAGISVYMAPDYRYDLSLIHQAKGYAVQLRYYLGAMQHTEALIPISGDKAQLRIEATGDHYTFYYSTSGTKFERIAAMNTRFLSSETAGGFTGVVLGLYAQSDSKTGSYADFEWFDYEPTVQK